MAEKQLSESAWKTFAKNKGYKDAELVKALAALARAEKEPPAAQLEAAEAVEEQAGKLAKANAKDKELATYAADIAKAVQREKTALQKEIAEAKAQQAKEDKQAQAAAKAAAQDDEADSPALLTSKLLTYLRAVQAKDELRYKALVGIAGKVANAVVDHSTIGGTHRTLLEKHIGQSGIKFIKGEVLREANCITFVLESGAGGPLAAKLKLGLFEQTGQRWKIRVRALDSKEVEETADEADDTPDATAPHPSASSTAAPTARSAAPATAASSGPSAADRERLATVTAAVKAAALAGHPHADEAKALLVRALQAQGRDAAELHTLLQQAEALLARPGTKASAATAPPTPTPASATAPTSVHDAKPAPATAATPEPEPGARPKGTLVQQRQFMLTRWQRIPIELRAHVDALQKAIADDEGDDDPQGLAKALGAYLDELVERLQDRLDAVVNSGDASQIRGVRQLLDGDPVLMHLATNPVLDGSGFRNAVVSALDEIETRFAA